MNSVQLANKVWKEIRQHSMLPSPAMLAHFVKKSASKEMPDLIVENAIHRIQERINKMREVQAKIKPYNTDEQNEPLLKEIGRLASTRIE